METHFSSQFFVANRQKLRQLFRGTAPIVITANGRLQRSGDNTFKFVQDANFWYLSGIDQPDILLVMDKDQEYLIVPARSKTLETFDGQLNHKELAKRSGIKTIYDQDSGYKKLGAKLKNVKHVATLASPDAYVEAYGFYTNPARARLINYLKQANPELKLLDLSVHLIRQRMIKQPAEIEAIKQAIDLTIKALKQATTPSQLKRYHYEYQLEAEITRDMRAQGAAGHGFAPIVASGARACVLHNEANSGRLKPKDLVLIDIGAEVDHYSADLTRTVALSSPTKRQQAVFSAVSEVRAHCFKLLRPGLVLKDYEKQVEHFMGEKLRELGLIKIINSNNVRKYYPHATSHFLGLNVHDVGDYSRPLEAGVVLTVEPGIYIKSEAIGIRIEDDVLVTEKGIEILSRRLPSQL